jgi:exonuclease SbcD
MENYGRLDPATGTSSRTRDFLDRLDEVVDFAMSQAADLVVFSGDAFKNRDPDPTQQREFARRIKKMAERTPVLLLVGNHDLPGTVSKATSLDIYQVLDIPNVIVGNKPEGRIVQTASGPLFLAWMPYPSRNRLLVDDEHKGKSLPELETALREAVSTYLRDLAAEAAKHDIPRVLAGHFTVSGAVFGSERTVMLGGDVAVSKSALADPIWDYVALGHIHKQQNLTDGEAGVPPVIYSGSLERIDFGEEREPKGFYWAEVGRGSVSFRSIPVHARPFYTLRVDARTDSNPTDAILAEIALRKAEIRDAILRIIVELTHDQASLIDDRAIRKAAAEASNLTIQPEIHQEARMRLGSAGTEALPPLEILKRYLQARQVTEDRISELLAAADQLMGDSGDEAPGD